MDKSTPGPIKESCGGAFPHLHRADYDLQSSDIMDASELPTHRPAEGRLLDLLDAAYALGEDPAWLDRFLDEAHTYVFAKGEGWKLASDLRTYAEPDPVVDRHVARIMRLSGHSGPDVHKTLQDQAANDALARVLIDQRGGVRWMNAAAAAWLGLDHAATISDLPLDPAALSHIRAALSDIRDGRAPEGSLHPMMRDHDGHSTLGVLRMVLTDGEPSLILSLTDVNWTPERVERIAKALSLTGREAVVLQGMLEGLSQRELAERAGRSIDTIKAQAKALLARTGVARMSDLVLLATSVVLLDDAAARGPARAPEGATLTQTDAARLGPGELMELPQGRVLEYRTFGDPNGVPMVFFHGLQIGPFLSVRMDAALARAGLRVVAPSRPAFGRTSPALSDESYNATTRDDTVYLIERLGLSHPVLIAHQGGVSHAYRTAKALDDDIRGIAMIGAGIPIEDDFIQDMNKMTRLAAVAVRHTPSIFELIAKLGVRHWRSTRDGPRRYLEKFYKDHPIDLAELDDPKIFPMLEAGLLHLTEQGPRALRLDGGIAMEDWSADFHAVTARTEWLQAAECPVMAAKFVTAFVARHSNAPVTVLEGTGYHLLYDREREVLDLLTRAARW